MVNFNDYYSFHEINIATVMACEVALRANVNCNDLMFRDLSEDTPIIKLVPLVPRISA